MGHCGVAATRERATVLLCPCSVAFLVTAAAGSLGSDLLWAKP